MTVFSLTVSSVVYTGLPYSHSHCVICHHTLTLDFVEFIYEKFSFDENFILKTDSRLLTILHGVWANDRVTSSDVISCHGNMETIAANIEAKNFSFLIVW
jgi:hypothetical protein